MLWNVLTTTPGRYVLFSLRLRSIDICFFYSRSINSFGLKWPLSRVLFLDNSFSGKFFDDPFCKGFFSDELFLNKGRKESGAPYLLKMCVFGLKNNFFWEVWYSILFETVKSLRTRVSINTTIDVLSTVDNSLVQILKLKFAKNFEPCFWSWYWSWSFVKILMYIFGLDFWSRSLVEILKLNFDQRMTRLKSSSYGESRHSLGLLCRWQCF